MRWNLKEAQGKVPVQRKHFTNSMGRAAVIVIILFLKIASEEMFNPKPVSEEV
ncbi:hypothetical protein [Petrotoga olearia]|uniref:Uncharacterized protein n=1 Tax=Petrotoga olearia DSM 13574 TaxID=1122955 RepID=A0A2K1P055_9BACT|nr:hypothetical protein [Petrotoga olearia]PNR96168.1 hypothetical protein X929_06090 [Petrotoga olearia DSM 13574]